MATEELLIDLSFMAPILIPMWMWGLVIMPIMLDDDTPEYKIGEEARQFRRSNLRLLKLTTWTAIVLSTLTIVVVYLKL